MALAESSHHKQWSVSVLLPPEPSGGVRAMEGVQHRGGGSRVLLHGIT